MTTAASAAAANGQHTSTALPAPGTWQLDAAHSSVEFVATHMVVAKVRGRFTGFQARITLDERPERSSVLVTIDAASISTNQEMRDNHLRGADFFDVANHPTITFVSRAVEPKGNRWAVTGDLTLKGIGRPVTLDLTYHGTVTDPRGNAKAIFSALGEIEREDFGLSWNQRLPDGGAMLGRSVLIEIAGQAVRVAEPSLVEIARSLEPVIRQHTEQMERERTLPASLVDLLYESGVFRTYLPRELGGLEVQPVEWLEMVEELSRVSGSVGWLAMINAGGTRLKPEVMRDVLAEHGRWISAANLGRIGGKAQRVEGGYRISGRWPFASGAPHSAFFSGVSIVYDDNDQVVLNPADDQPLTVSATWPIEPGQIVDTWDGLGLRGTGSHDIVVDELYVPDAFISAGMRDRPYPGPLYRGMFLFMAHAAHALGIARAAIDAFVELCAKVPAQGSRRQSGMGKSQLQQVAVGRADALVRAARLLAWDATARAYEAAERDGAVPLDLRILMDEAMIFAVRSAKDAVDLVFEAAGASSVYRGTTLERCFRDIHTAAQHIIVTENRYDAVGQYYITRDQAGGPVLDRHFPF